MRGGKKSWSLGKDQEKTKGDEDAFDGGGRSFWEREILISRGLLKVSGGLKVIEVKKRTFGWWQGRLC
jgi:hypothetical protein